MLSAITELDIDVFYIKPIFRQIVLKAGRKLIIDQSLAFKKSFKLPDKIHGKPIFQPYKNVLNLDLLIFGDSKNQSSISETAEG
jgi:hypothetical protein